MPQIVTALIKNRQWEGPLNFSTIGIRKPEWPKSTFCGTADAELEKNERNLEQYPTPFKVPSSMASCSRGLNFRRGFVKEILDSSSWLNNAH